MPYNFLTPNSFFSMQAMPFLLLIAAWTLPWKGVALWRAAKNHHKGWFIALLILNTLAILEIIYIFHFSKKKSETSEKI